MTNEIVLHWDSFTIVVIIWIGFSNPYVVFKVKNKLVHRSCTLYKNLNPRWAETFSYRFHSMPITKNGGKDVGGRKKSSNGVTSYRRLVQLRIIVRNHIVGQRDEYMGEALLDTNNLTLNELVVCAILIFFVWKIVNIWNWLKDALIKISTLWHQIG